MFSPNSFLALPKAPEAPRSPTADELLSDARETCNRSLSFLSQCQCSHSQARHRRQSLIMTQYGEQYGSWDEEAWEEAHQDMLQPDSVQPQQLPGAPASPQRPPFTKAVAARGTPAGRPLQPTSLRSVRSSACLNHRVKEPEESKLGRRRRILAAACALLTRPRGQRPSAEASREADRPTDRLEAVVGGDKGALGTDEGIGADSGEGVSIVGSRSSSIGSTADSSTRSTSSGGAVSAPPMLAPPDPERPRGLQANRPSRLLLPEGSPQSNLKNVAAAATATAAAVPTAGSPSRTAALLAILEEVEGTSPGHCAGYTAQGVLGGSGPACGGAQHRSFFRTLVGATSTLEHSGTIRPGTAAAVSSSDATTAAAAAAGSSRLQNPPLSSGDLRTPAMERCRSAARSSCTLASGPDSPSNPFTGEWPIKQMRRMSTMSLSLSPTPLAVAATIPSPPAHPAPRPGSQPNVLESADLPRPAPCAQDRRLTVDARPTSGISFSPCCALSSEAFRESPIAPSLVPNTSKPWRTTQPYTGSDLDPPAATLQGSGHARSGHHDRHELLPLSQDAARPPWRIAASDRQQPRSRPRPQVWEIRSLSSHRHPSLKANRDGSSGGGCGSCKESSSSSCPSAEAGNGAGWRSSVTGDSGAPGDPAAGSGGPGIATEPQRRPSGHGLLGFGSWSSSSNGSRQAANVVVPRGLQDKGGMDGVGCRTTELRSAVEISGLRRRRGG